LFQASGSALCPPAEMPPIARNSRRPSMGSLRSTVGISSVIQTAAPARAIRPMVHPVAVLAARHHHHQRRDRPARDHGIGCAHDPQRLPLAAVGLQPMEEVDHWVPAVTLLSAGRAVDQIRELTLEHRARDRLRHHRARQSGRGDAAGRAREVPGRRGAGARGSGVAPPPTLPAAERQAPTQ
jgi:hypothetical protein